MSDECDENPYGCELSGPPLNGQAGGQEGFQEQSSPRVVIRKDGSLRVEFTNSSGNPLLLDQASGPVQLLKFSPNLEPAPTSSPSGSNGSRQDGPRGAPPPASTSSSKGSSLSSDGSWYDSPWGPSAELCEQDPPCPSSMAVQHMDSYPEPSPPVSITDLYQDATMAATFPSADDGLSFQVPDSLPGQRQHRASLASALDVPADAWGQLPQYSSYTLPCRRPKAHTMGAERGQYDERQQAVPDSIFQKKDSIKSRMRRLSDWTGSLSRKKRRCQVSPRRPPLGTEPMAFQLLPEEAAVLTAALLPVWQDPFGWEAARWCSTAASVWLFTGGRSKAAGLRGGAAEEAGGCAVMMMLGVNV